MALDFPNSPALGATYSSGASTWKWDGTKWVQIALAGNPLIVVPPIAASWTQRNFVGTTSLTDVANGVFLKETTIQNGDVLRMASLVAPTAPYTIDAIFNLICSSNGAMALLLGWTDTTKYHLLDISFNGVSPNLKSIYSTRWSNTTTNTSDVVYRLEWSPNQIFMRMADDGTNIVFSISVDGVNFIQIYTVAKASGNLSSYSNVTWGLSANSAGASNQPPACMVTLNSWRVH